MTEQAPPGSSTTPVPDVFVPTYRMLRLGMAGMAFAILLSVVVQTLDQDCPLTSISAYWYTSSRTIFVSCLVAISICLLALRGGTWTENLLLNLAGVLAPLVAIVPTGLGQSEDLACLSLSGRPPLPTADIDNGMIVFTALAVIGLVVTWISSNATVAREVRRRGKGLNRRERLARTIGLGLGASLALGPAAWRVADEESFGHGAHFTAAIAMFTCMVLVVAFRTRRLSRVSAIWDIYRDDSVEASMTRAGAALYSVTYGIIAAVMGFTIVGAIVLLVFDLWAFTVISAEALLLGLFMLFWCIQSRQLQDIAVHACSSEVVGEQRQDMRIRHLA